MTTAHPERPDVAPPVAAPAFLTPAPSPAPLVVVQPTRASLNGLAVVSLVFSVLWLFWIGSVIGLFTGIKAMDDIDHSAGAQSGKGLAVTGVVISGLSLLPLVFILMAVIA
jgi:hypothetical protein